MIRANRLAFAAFSIADPAPLATYYEQVIGLAPQGLVAGAQAFATPQGDTCIRLAPGDTTRLTRLGLYLPPGAPLADMTQHLRREGLGADLRSDPYPGIGHSLVLSDPNGIEVELLDAAPTPVEVPPSPAISPSEARACGRLYR